MTLNRNCFKAGTGGANEGWKEIREKRSGGQIDTVL